MRIKNNIIALIILSLQFLYIGSLNANTWNELSKLSTVIDDFSAFSLKPGQEQSTILNSEDTNSATSAELTKSTALELVDYTLTEETSVYQIALRNDLTVEQLHVFNNGRLKDLDTLPEGEVIRLPKDSLMVKLAQRTNPQTSDSSNSTSTLPELSSRASKEDAEGNLFSEVLYETPVGGYTKNDAEKNTALLLQDAAERNWDEMSSEQIKQDVENWAEGYVDGKVNAVKSKVLGEANNFINKPINDFLGRFGNAQFSLSVDEKGNVSASDFKLFSPLYDVEQNLVFGQVGVHEQGAGDEERLIGNFGLGYRYDTDDYLLGGNVFIDHDFTGNNTRLGLGAEYWRDYLKLAANYYAPLSHWKDSDVLLDFQERPAEGFDIRAQGYLPSYPQLGGSLQFEQYFGDEVALFALDDRQRDPYAFTAGVDYTPVPAITAKTSYKMGEGGRDETRFDLDFNLRIGVPLEDQFNPDNVAIARSLKGSRYDMVDRNYDIVFEYKAKTIEVEIKEVVTPIVLGTDAQVRTIRISNRSPITKHVWYRYSQYNPHWTPIADEINSGYQSLVDTNLMPGKYKYRLFVETETGATGVSNEVEIDVISSGTLLTNVNPNRSANVSSNSIWSELNINQIGVDPRFSGSYQELEYVTSGNYPASPDYLHTLYYTVDGIEKSIPLIWATDIADFDDVNADLLGVIVPDEISLDAEGNYSKWKIYVLVDDRLIPLGETKAFDFKVETRSRVSGVIQETSNTIVNVVFTHPLSIVVGSFKYEIDMHIVDLDTLAGPFSLTRNTDAYEGFEATVCQRIAKNGSDDSSVKDLILTTTELVVTQLDLEGSTVTAVEKVNTTSNNDQSNAKVNNHYGVCIIKTKAFEITDGQEVLINSDAEVINDDVQNSIVWRYWDDQTGETNDDLSITIPIDTFRNYLTVAGSDVQQLIPSQNQNTFKLNEYYGLEGCRAKSVFITQTSNMNNNQFIWGQLGEQGIGNEDDIGTRWTEQGLRLTVQFDAAELNDGKSYGPKEPGEVSQYPNLTNVCENFTANPILVTNVAKAFFSLDYKTSDNNITQIIPDNELGYVGVWH